MFLTYVGESGTTGSSLTDASQPHMVFTGLFVHESQSMSMTGEFSALCRRHFGAPLGEGDAPSEIRPRDLFQGLGYFSSWPTLKRNELIQDCLGVMVRRETPVVTSFINKQEFAEAKAAVDPDLINFDTAAHAVVNKFFFALSMFMDEFNLSLLSGDQIMDGTIPPSNFALPVAPTASSLKSRFLTEFLRSDEGMDSTALMHNVCYVESEHSVGNQLSNLCAYFVRRWLQNPDRVHPYFEGLRDSRVIQVIYPVTIYNG
ncbi:MAG TPA: hypothetical protein DHW65_00995 [Dehalococcoidia bacterium]|nr:hypothetical protein [Dehalococcoidia bacterium]|tara:strand:- start:1610 stop:2386 length:777 start_codon:yes stop_codon:yes gene_type:complete